MQDFCAVSVSPYVEWMAEHLMTTELNYEPQVAWYRSRKFRRWVRISVLTLSAAVIVYLGIRFVPWFVGRWMLLREQDKAMNCMLPAGEFVYGKAMAATPPAEIEMYCRLVPEVNDMMHPTAPLSERFLQPAILHRMTYEGGERLVFVYYAHDPYRGIVLRYCVIRPATMRNDPVLLEEGKLPYRDLALAGEPVNVEVIQADLSTIRLNVKKEGWNTSRFALYQLTSDGNGLGRTYVSEQH